MLARQAVAVGVVAVAAALPGPGAAQSPRSGQFTLEQVDAGRAQFHRTCAQCHGRNMVNSGTTVFDLRKFPLDDPERFFNSVTHGKGNPVLVSVVMVAGAEAAEEPAAAAAAPAAAPAAEKAAPAKK